MKWYGALDLLFAALYAWFCFIYSPGRSLGFNVTLAVVVGLLAAAGVGLIAGLRWARPVALLACAALLVWTAVVILLLVASSAYLQGAYGPLGTGLSVLVLLAIALIVELFALLPLFQLRFLLARRD